MQDAIPANYLPDDESSPDFLYTLPETHYPPQVNAATEMVDRHVAEGRGDNVAIYFEGEETTYAELHEQVNRLGNALRELGVAPGERVFVRFPNRPEYVVAFLAAQKIGAVPVPSMKLLRAREIEYVLQDAEASVAVVYDDLLAEVEAAIAGDGPTLDDLVVVERTGVDHDHRIYNDLVEAASPELDGYDTHRDDISLVAYTSGTTGRPKGTVHTHRQMLAITDTYARYCLEPTEDDVFSGNPPLAFTFGYGMLVAFPFRFGAATSIIEDATPEKMLDTIDRDGVTVLGSIPTAYNQMLSDHAETIAEADLSSLRLGVSAGEPLQADTFDRVKEALGIELIDGIGSTEMLHIFISHRHTDDIDPTATGVPVPGYECKVVDPETGEEQDRGKAGVLHVRGPTGVTYWNRPDKQRENTADGWTIPGDVFVHREDGRFEYKSRRDDLIITGGYNVPGPEVEGVLLEHPDVYEVAVVASPDDERGHIVKAFVVLEDGVEPSDALTNRLQDHVKERIAPYKYPREIEYLDALPKTETGKIRRVALRERER